MSKLRLTIAWHEKYVCKWVKQVGIDTPQVKNLVYGLDMKPLVTARKKCCIGVRRPAVRTRKSVTHKCITHSTW